MSVSSDVSSWVSWSFSSFLVVHLISCLPTPASYVLRCVSAGQRYLNRLSSDTTNASASSAYQSCEHRVLQQLDGPGIAIRECPLRGRIQVELGCMGIWDLCGTVPTNAEPCQHNGQVKTSHTDWTQRTWIFISLNQGCGVHTNQSSQRHEDETKRCAKKTGAETLLSACRFSGQPESTNTHGTTKKHLGVTDPDRTKAEEVHGTDQ